MSSATVTISLLRLSPNSAFRLAELLLDHLRDARRLGEDVEQVGDRRDHLAVLVADLVLLQAGEAPQLQVDDRLRLLVGKVIAVVLQAERRTQAFGAGTAPATFLPPCS
jgi:hypothetical protein